MARKLFTNARVVTQFEVFLGTVEVHLDRIVRVEIGATSLPGAQDLDGDYLLPGLVDLAAEGAPCLAAFDGRDAAARGDLAIRSLSARDVARASAGITTVFDVVTLPATTDRTGQTIGLEDAARALGRLRSEGALRASHFLHLALADAVIAEAFAATSDAVAATPGFVSVASRPAAPVTAGAVRQLADACAANRVPLAIACTGRAEDGQLAREAGVRHLLGRIPVRRATDRQREGLAPILTGPVSGSDRAGAIRIPPPGACAIASGNAPMRMLRAAFELKTHHDCGLHDAIGPVSRLPAQIAGLPDRGSLAVGLRADMVRVRLVGHTPVPVETWRGGVRVA